MVGESLPGQMGPNMTESTKRERNTGREGSHTPPRKFTTADGRTGSKKVKEGFIAKLAASSKREFGRMALIRIVNDTR